MEPQKIIRDYAYDGKDMKTWVLYFPDRSIATVTSTTDEMGGLDMEIVREGMEKDEIETFFPAPPAARKKGATFNLALLVRSIIYEAYKKEGTTLEEGNVRNFWYTHLKVVITKVLGLSESDSVVSCLNKAWGDLINSGLVTYEGMNVVGGKETSRTSIVKNSPFSNLIVAVEKQDYFDHFSWIPRLFNCTLITAGGQPSRSVARAFIRQLADLGVDLDQEFFMCVASDLDPAGYYIQDAFRKQFEAAIEFYGGEGHVTIRRLFVRRDQVTEALLKSEAMPCRDSARTEAAKKAENTKWEYFVKETGGGLYIPKPVDWDGVVYDTPEGPMVRALLEMNAFPKSVIERAVTQELLKIITETNDESKIMIPEVMRIFELMRGECVDEVFEDWRRRLIQPLIDEFLEETKRWEDDISDKEWDEVHAARKDRNEKLEEVNDDCDERVEEKQDEAREQEPELHEKRDDAENEIADLQSRIADLEGQIETLNDEIKSKCPDIFEEIDQIEEEREERCQPIREEFNKKERIAERKTSLREERLESFRGEHATEFNPLEMALKNDVAETLSPENVSYFFTDIEEMDEFKPHIAKLLTEPDLLLEEGQSCFDQPVPTFTEEDLLVKASKNHDENVENFRRAFTPDFKKAMKGLITSHAEDAEFEVKGEVAERDLTDLVNEAMEATETEVEETDWEEDEEEDE